MHDNADLRIRTEPDGQSRIVHLEGELSLLNAGALRTALMEGLQPGARTVLDAAGITSIDLSGLQLICSAHKTYATRGAVLEFGEVSGALRESARSAGYGTVESACDGERRCLWDW